MSDPIAKWTPERVKAFRKAYDEAPEGETFTFEDKEYLKRYAKLFIEYLESRFREAE